MGIRESLPHRLQLRTGAINLKRLEHETNRLLAAGLLVAVVIHAMLFSFVTFEHTKPNVPKPFITQLIIRPPRPTRPYVIPRHDYEHHELERRIIERMPSGTFEYKSLPTPEELIELAEDMKLELSVEDIHEVVAGVMAEVDRRYHDTLLDSIYRENFSLEIAEYLKGIEREMTNMISLRENLLSVDDLDTGRYRGLVIKDPSDKLRVRGFIHIPSSIWGVQLGQGNAGSTSLYPPDTGRMAVIGLAEGMSSFTGISMTLDGQLYIDKPGLQKYPIVYITSDRTFTITSNERENFGAYLKGGGFAILEPYSVPAFSALSAMVTETLGERMYIGQIPADHPFLHCYYDFDDPTFQFQSEDMLTPGTVLYLNGVFWRDQLVAVMFTGEYGEALADYSFDNPYFRIAANAVIYSLIRQGSAAKQYLDADF